MSPARRLAELAEVRKSVFSMRSEKALDTILNAPSPPALVHSFSKQDFYLLIHKIGIEDSFELLSLASSRQWEHILDMETWEKDRFQVPAAVRWLGLLLRADPRRLTRWSLEDKAPFFSLLLSRTVEVKIREHDQDPSVFEDDFFTFDDVFYLRVKGDFFEDDAPDAERERVFTALTEFLKLLADQDHKAFQWALLESSSVIPAESEEDMFKTRLARLEEEGLPPFHEAIGIYQPAPFPKTGAGAPVKEETFAHTSGPAPGFLPEMIIKGGPFERALASLDPDDDLKDRVKTQFAMLCDRVIIADLKTIRDPGQLRDAVKKACGYLNCALERLQEMETQKDRRTPPGDILRRHSLENLFRAGYGLALALKRRAGQWAEKSWWKSRGLALDFWDEEWMGVLGGLFLKRPLFFENRREENVMYREFFSGKDLASAENDLEAIIEMDRTLSMMPIERAFSPKGFLTFKSLLLTMWAKDFLNAPEKNAPLETREMARLFEALWPDGEKSPPLGDGVKESFLKWIADASGQSPADLSRSLGAAFEGLFAELESERWDFKKGDIDPRRVRLFLTA